MMFQSLTDCDGILSEDNPCPIPQAPRYHKNGDRKLDMNGDPKRIKKDKMKIL